LDCLVDDVLLGPTEHAIVLVLDCLVNFVEHLHHQIFIVVYLEAQNGVLVDEVGLEFIVDSFLQLLYLYLLVFVVVLVIAARLDVLVEFLLDVYLLAQNESIIVDAQFKDNGPVLVLLRVEHVELSIGGHFNRLTKLFYQLRKILLHHHHAILGENKELVGCQVDLADHILFLPVLVFGP
jgi:hypothetical protein